MQLLHLNVEIIVGKFLIIDIMIIIITGKLNILHLVVQDIIITTITIMGETKLQECYNAEIVKKLKNRKNTKQC